MGDSTVVTTPYGAWRSPIDAALAASHDGHPEYVGTVGDEVWWTAPRPDEGGRRTLMRRRPGGAEISALPAPWNVRSRVMEYGGLPWAAVPRPSGGPLVVFAHFADQRLYVYEPDDPAGAPPRPLTPVSDLGGGLRWADLRLHADRGEVWGVLEEFTGEGPTDVRRVIAAVPLDGSAAEDRAAVRELSDDRHRFVTGPQLSPDGRRVAWIAWDHPRMPWDGTVVMVAEVAEDGRFAGARAVLGGPGESVAQAEWGTDGTLLAATDRTGWWNLHQLDPEEACADTAFGAGGGAPLAEGGVASPAGDAGGRPEAGAAPGAGAAGCAGAAGGADVVRGAGAAAGAGVVAGDPDADAAPGAGAAAGAGRPVALCPRQEEFGGPMWKLGLRWFAPLPGGLVAVVHGRGAARLGILDPRTRELADVPGPWTEWDATLAVAGSRVVGVAASPHSSYEVVELDTRTGHARVIGAAHTDPVDPAYYPRPVERTFTGPGGRDVHAHIYPPHNPDHTAPDGELPPYVVWAHGGPTDRAPLVLDLQIAYFTSRGIGVAEVNYGGSTGYGRAYRDRLREQWGVVDVEDCAAVAEALAEEGSADRARLAIRGGSAGGWTAAASLTATGLYACATVKYPVLDLTDWTDDGTHDFESRYMETMIGPLAEVPDRYRDRSPAHRADRVFAPFLLLQGLDDPVCPPVQCERFLAAVAGRGVPHAYLTFEGEGHGFRRADTMVRALEAELGLYARTFGLTPPGVPALELTG
ncbi:prolyl oligopeptidase family serine peptidase [Streptomyces sp. ME19-01-6]|uniref:S9 family peptidase n=1 Tax=Streptomyces sp. ME19-01-6 TaxID=3028686 RepID=UPI0029A9704E|nr:prolyl oligopeptidase family serine peptidase [Streptomyces sp. ME19-01-6]MDX3228814.1 prolyl oligopeptidase family serine peptidase [Streptomyces sp. ME19-01-6]